MPMTSFEDRSDRRDSDRREIMESEPRTFGSGATLPFDPDSTWSTPLDDADATYPLRER
jgi:hypothetical protein